jgi:hypothetical protein
MSGPSVHPVLLAVAPESLYLAPVNHRIDRRCPPMDRRFIRHLHLRGFISAIRPTQLETGPSDHPMVPIQFGLRCSVPTTPTLLLMYRRFIRRCPFSSFPLRLQLVIAST